MSEADQDSTTGSDSNIQHTIGTQGDMRFRDFGNSIVWVG
jgi:hypothetical protein